MLASHVQAAHSPVVTTVVSDGVTCHGLLHVKVQGMQCMLAGVPYCSDAVLGPTRL